MKPFVCNNVGQSFVKSSSSRLNQLNFSRRTTSNSKKGNVLSARFLLDVECKMQGGAPKSNMFYIHGEIMLCITRDHFSSPFRLMVEKSSLKKKKHCFLNECFKNATTLQICKDPSLSQTHNSNFVTCGSGKKLG